MTESHTADFGQSFGAPSQPAVPIGSRPIGQVNGENSGAWIPSLASVLEKQEEKQGAIQPPPGAVFTPSTGASTAQLAAWRASNGYGARSAHGSALPAFELPPSRSRNNGVVALVLILLLVVGGAGAGYWYFLRNKSTTTQVSNEADRSLAFPAQAAGRHRIEVPASVGQQFRTVIGRVSPGAVDHAQMAFFAKDGSKQPDVVVLAFRIQDSPVLVEQVTNSGVGPMVDSFAGNAFNKSRLSRGLHPIAIESKDPGKLGGGMSCTATFESDTGGCIWADRTWMAMTVVETKAGASVDDIASATRSVRESAEH